MRSSPQNSRVRFAVDMVSVFGSQHDSSSNLVLSDVDLVELWWSESELKSFQNSATLLKKEIMKHSKIDTRHSFADILTTTFLSCDFIDGPTPKQRHYLREWTRNAPSRRGIENLIVSELALIRKDKKRKAIEDVLTAQECCSNLCQDMKAEFIRSISECRSMTARNFASMIGDADAYAEGFKIISIRRSSTSEIPRLLLHQRIGGEKNVKLNLVNTMKMLNLVNTMKRINIKKRISI
jgi:hypothetical protein